MAFLTKTDFYYSRMRLLKANHILHQEMTKSKSEDLLFFIYSNSD
ncbi:hypothetical protein K710_2065 [Streptococcus iniae SF1]|nr:hypothetical protein [Streptococcus iniae]AGM99807.1 hypothetical protein K710_2065 [Streptococcus iniae SF1]EKB53139.1 hypothetical protein A0G_0974 [Streptococcus iniae 9117]ESR09614.1 hypothetical protein IUSA1_05985 [Streptococcus iniae IUSA1]